MVQIVDVKCIYSRLKRNECALKESLAQLLLHEWQGIMQDG